ncbi:MAG: M48 family metalloprotease [Acidobacteriota bacterium]|nr:M48 family metalloprotease [Acidobacteriota bacterium]
MKQWSVFALTFLLLTAVLVTSQKQKIAAPVGPEAVLSLIADSEDELTRLPATFIRVSDVEEIRIGNQLAREYSSGGVFGKEVPTTRAVQAYVNRVGARVAVGAHRKLPYQFHYVSDPDFINAFALPGGHIFIGGGLMALMDSEDELASVLAHEVEHIDRYHCADRVQTQAALQKVPLGALVAIPVEVFEAGYSKTQELEADREGTQLAVKARYSPLGAVRMFQTFDRLFHERTSRAQSPQEELSTLAIGTLEGYFRSHPPASERIAQIQLMISDNHWESLTSEQPLEVAYVYLTQRAGRALTAKNYAAAENAATRSLALHADQTNALTILAEAQFGLMEFPAALASYRQLLKESPPDAAAVGEFANSIATNALNVEQFAVAAKFASGSLDLQPDNAPALIVLADAQMALGDYAAAGSTHQRLINLYPVDAERVITYTAWTARRASAAHRYQQTLGVSAFWLTLRPNEREALTIEASAELALGDFSAAAKTYRKLLDLTPRNAPVDMLLVWNYADALSAAKAGQEAANDFHGFMLADRTVSNTTIENQIKIEYAGLALMAGDSALARDLVDEPRGIRGSWIPPEIMARLGWWHYRAGKYPEAAGLLQHLAQERPGNSGIQNDLAWVELEQNEGAAAIQQFSMAERRQEIVFAQWNTPQMGLAIALWRSHRVDEAMKNYELASNAEPRWTNPLQVQTFFSRQVAQNVAEMQAEQAKRLEAQKRKGLAKR